MSHPVRALLASFLWAAAVLSSVVRAEGTERLYLSGHDRADAVAWDFRCSAGAKAGEWAKLPVPSNWEMHGFGTMSYHSTEPSEVGEYRRVFSVPAGWAGRRVFLVFDGAMTDTTARLNGTQVGPTHRGGFYRFRYEVTGLVRTGAENTLEVSVAETSADESVNRAERTGDYWNFGGIYRPVWLESVPAPFIAHVAIAARADGSLRAEVEVDGAGEATRVEAQVRELDGRPFGGSLVGTPGADGMVRLNGRFEGARLWNAEEPNLYRLEVRLVAGEAVRQVVGERFGFRTFEVRPHDGFYLNDRKIVLQGANRHSFHPESGRCLAERDHREDIRLMQEANMNAVRMSHYPPDERFLELCDELGLYVLDELAGWQKSYSAEAGRPLVREMVRRDVNHPSILFWDNGNEGGWETTLDADFARHDPQGRPVLHPWDVHGGVNTAHYRQYDQTVAMAAGGFVGLRRNRQPMEEPRPLIYMPTEFLHGLYDGGAGAGLEDYWDVMRRSPVAGGGFLWAWIDEGVRRPDTGVIDVAGNQAPDGILGPYREKEASFFTVKDVWCPVVVRERELPADFDGTLTVENRFGFTALAACRFHWELRRLADPGSAAAETAVVAAGVAATLQVVPGASGPLHLGLPADWRAADVLALRVDDPSGRELWTWTWPLAGLDRWANWSTMAASPRVANVEVTDESERLRARAGDLVVEIGKRDGRLLSVRRGERVFSFSNGPRPAVGAASVETFAWRRAGGDLVVEATYTGALSAVTWIVRANGWLDCEYAYTATQPTPYRGICFDYPERLVRAKTWVGEGPYRVWANRRRGTTLGLWHNTYNDTVTGWSGFEYPEFKGCFGKVRWLRLETAEGPITVVAGDARGADLQVLRPSFPPADLLAKTVVELPDCGLAVLDAIPAIGTKFSPADRLGPQGQPAPVPVTHRGRVSLRFGE